MREHENSPDEARFIREYVALTGASESQGRSAFMYACDQPAPAERAVSPGISGIESVRINQLEPHWSSPNLISDSIQPAHA
jgi:hypothetical protein